MNKTHPLVSVIISTYNYGQYISDAIESVLEQTYKNLELIIVDDGSTDNTRKIIEGMSNDLSYYYKTNGGASSARNLGSKKAKGEYIIFLDADNKLHKKYIEETLLLINGKKNDVGYVYTQLQYFDASDYVTQYPGYNINYLKVQNYIDTCCLMKTSIAKQFKFDNRLSPWEDWDFYLTLAENNVRGTLLNKPLLYYRKHYNKDSLLDKMDVERRVKVTHLLRKNHWRLYGIPLTIIHYCWYVCFKLKIVKVY